MNEYIICGSLATVFSIATAFFTYMNLTWNWQNTSAANKFGHEMDCVMGRMLGIPHFSKLEGLMMGIGTIGLWMSWLNEPALQYYCILLQCAILMYFMICLVYFIIVEQAVLLCLGIVIFTGGIIFWRLTSFLDHKVYADQLSIFLVCLMMIWVAFSVKMVLGARNMSLEIKKFQQTEKFCKDNPSFVWKSGKDAPNGFELKRKFL